MDSFAHSTKATEHLLCNGQVTKRGSIQRIEKEPRSLLPWAIVFRENEQVETRLEASWTLCFVVLFYRKAQNRAKH